MTVLMTSRGASALDGWAGRWRLPADRAALARARAITRAATGIASLSRARAHDVELAVAELAGNALQHATGPYELRLRARAGTLMCAVVDGAPGRVAFPRPSELTPPAAAGGLDALIRSLPEQGRGLAIVAWVAAGRCGYRPARTSAGIGKLVWFAVEAPADSGRS